MGNQVSTRPSITKEQQQGEGWHCKDGTLLGKRNHRNAEDQICSVKPSVFVITQTVCARLMVGSTTLRTLLRKRPLNQGL